MTIPHASPQNVTRYAAGTRDSKGRYTAGASSVVSVNMSIQPISKSGASNADKSLADRFGVRNLDGAIRIFAESELMTEDKASVEQADRLTWQGQLYEIEAVSYWSGPLPHWFAIGCLADEKTV